MKNINPNQEYRPSEIAKNNWIKNRVGKGDYFKILKLIKVGRLKARNYCLSEQMPMWLVLGSEIIKYNKRNGGELK